MKRLTSLLVMLVLVGVAIGQPTEEWTGRWGYNGYGVAHKVVADDSGNVYITGICNGSGSYPMKDIVTIKYNSAGSYRWVKQFDGYKDGEDRGYDVAVDDSGNVYVAALGRYQSYNFDGLLLKYTPSGSLHWVRSTPSAYELCCVEVDDSGYIYVAGRTDAGPDIILIKYNTYGTQQWSRTYNGPANKADVPVDMVLDQDNNIYVTGYSNDANNRQDYVVLKYNPDGTYQWDALYSGGSRNVANGVAVDDIGNVYVTGWSGDDYATIKYDSLGTQLWVSRYSEFQANLDSATAIGVDQTGNVYVTGKSFSEAHSFDFATVKYNSQGDEQWVRRFSSEGQNWDQGNDLSIDNSGRIYVTGSFYQTGVERYDCMTIKYDPSGNELWTVSYHGPQDYDYDRSYSIAVDEEKNVYIAGTNDNEFTLTVKYSQVLTDLEVVSLNSPEDTVLSARTYTPQATITNLEGESVDFPVICEFDSSGVVVYCDTVQIVGLGDGDTALVSFADWTTGQADGINYTMSVTAIAADEANPDNNILSKQVYATWSPPDVGTISLEVPSDSAYLGTTYAPQATVANFNEYPALGFDVVCEFSSVEVTMYSDTVHVTDLDSMATTQVTFADWTPTADLPYRMTVFTICEDDRDPSNDEKSKVILVLPPDRDLAAIAIDAPPDEVTAGSSHAPKATFKNMKSETVSFEVMCEFDSAGVVVYTDTVLIFDLAGGDSRQISFANWSAAMSEGVSYTMLVLASTEGDANPSNNMLTKSVVTVPSVHDVAPIAITSPPDLILAGQTYTPAAEVKNLGADPETFDVRCQFDSAGVSVYSDIVTVNSLDGSQSVVVEFLPWLAGTTGEFTYTMTVVTLLASDLNPANDLLTKQVTTAEALADLDIQDYSGNLSANTMELTGVRNSVVVGSYVMVNPDNWEKNVDLYDGPANVDLDLSYSWTDLTTYDGRGSISSDNVDPNVNALASLALGDGALNIVQVYIPKHKVRTEGTYVGKVTVTGEGEGSVNADEFGLKVIVVPGFKCRGFSGEPLAEGNQLYWSEFGFGETGFNLYRAVPGSEEFFRLNDEEMNLTSYTDHHVEANKEYQYKLGLVMDQGREILLGPLSLGSSEEVGTIVLYQSWPNPWVDETEISYFLPSGVSSASLKIYDISGKLVTTLAEGVHEAGHHSVMWNGTDAEGLEVSSGVYFYRLSTENQTRTGKMLLLR